MHRFFAHFSLRVPADEIGNPVVDLIMSPYLHKLDVDAYEQFDYVLNSPTFVPLAIDRLQLVKGLILQTDQKIAVRVYEQIDQELTIDADGLLLLWDTNLRTVSAPMIQVRVASIPPEATFARLTGIAVGTSVEEEYTGP